jgi:aerobic-type carbon monoxide dehydrogenase small subunit (CoxS/CutS family)
MLQETLLETEVHMLLNKEMNSGGDTTNGTGKQQQQQGAFKVLLDNRRVNVDLAFKALMEQAVVIRLALTLCTSTSQ